MTQQLSAETKDKLMKISDSLWYLKQRWADEKEYEDWQDYCDAVKKNVESKGGIYCSFNKRFHVTMQLDGWLIELWPLVDGAKYRFKKL